MACFEEALVFGDEVDKHSLPYILYENPPFPVSLPIYGGGRGGGEFHALLSPLRAWVLFKEKITFARSPRLISQADSVLEFGGALLLTRQNRFSEVGGEHYGCILGRHVR